MIQTQVLYLFPNSSSMTSYRTNRVCVDDSVEKICYENGRRSISGQVQLVFELSLSNNYTYFTLLICYLILISVKKSNIYINVNFYTSI
jgi:hypothetical protein